MTFDITQILCAVASLLAAIVTSVVVPYIRSKTTTDQQKQIAVWVKIAVSAAEQIYNGSGQGEKKFQYVSDWLRENGITMDEKMLKAMIESAVYELKNGSVLHT